MTRVVALIQARLSSSRLPAKLALDVLGRPLLARVAERVRLAGDIDDLVVATSDAPADDVTAQISRSCGLKVFRGDLVDARSRFLSAAQELNADVLLRVTGDNPFVEPRFISELIAKKRAEPALPYAVHDLEKVVHGTATELIDVAALHRAAQTHRSPFECEHITPALREGPGAMVIEPPQELSDSRLSLSVDTLDDYVSAVRLYLAFGPGPELLDQVLEAFQKQTLPVESFRFRSPD